MTTGRRLIIGHVAIVLSIVLLSDASTRGARVRFYPDDPVQREPESQDASAVQDWEIDLFWDLADNLFGRPGDPTPDVRARNINTADEVPDSNWFTNRIGTRPVTIEEALRGPVTGAGPAPGVWLVTRPKQTGFAPGFTMRDAQGETWFVSFDAKGQPEAATGAIMVANKIFWTLGYWQVEQHLIRIRPDQLKIDEAATVTPPSGVKRPMTFGDIEAVLRRAHRSQDGAYRAVAARAIPGRPIGGFRYYGTRPDDPNDVIPHEHRRELRALKVFGAWTNLVDMKAGNTLDTLISDGGKHVVRHYLQDVGSTFGTGANAPHDYDEGWEHLYEGDLVWKRLITVGFHLQPWQTVRYTENPSIGRFEGAAFEPDQWRPRVPTAAFLRARADDNFWAARRVMAFSDEMIRSLVTAGEYSDASAAALLTRVLIERRDKIGRVYLNAINPVVNFRLDARGVLTFDNAAVMARVASEPAGGYVVRWSTFDNASERLTPLGPTTAAIDGRTSAQAPLPVAPGAIVQTRIAAASSAQSAWTVPVDVYFRLGGTGWTVVGVDRLPRRDGDDASRPGPDTRPYQ
ncbi:MAG TPA: hypothetical protein VF159_04065 [Gemmatimonadaceae bacterium]